MAAFSWVDGATILAVGGLLGLGYGVVAPWTDEGATELPGSATLFEMRSTDGLLWEGAASEVVAFGLEPELAQVGGELTLFYRGVRGLVEATEGLSGWEPEPLRTMGLPPGALYSPSVVSLPDGGERLYVGWTSDAEDGRPVISLVRSALRDEEGVWNFEQGACFAAPSLDELDVVAASEGGWRLYYTTRDEGLRSALSEDGRVFEDEEGSRLALGADPNVITQPDGSIRTWLMRNDGGWPGLLAADSKDGLRFRVNKQARHEPGVDQVRFHVPAASPAVWRSEDGNWRMIFAAPHQWGGSARDK